MPEIRLVGKRIGWAELLDAFQQLALDYVYAERMEGTVLTTLMEFVKINDPSRCWKHGRAFNQQTEVAWWQKSGRYEVRLATDDSQFLTKLPLAQDPNGEAIITGDEHEYLLIGERDAAVETNLPVWSTSRIPRYLRYPADGQWSRVVLTATIYYLDGMVIDQRLRAVRGLA